MDGSAEGHTSEELNCNLHWNEVQLQHHSSHICFKTLPSCWNIFEGHYPWRKASSALMIRMTSTSSSTRWGFSQCTRLFWDNTDVEWCRWSLAVLLKCSSLSLGLLAAAPGKARGAWPKKRDPLTEVVEATHHTWYTCTNKQFSVPLLLWTCYSQAIGP